MEAIRVPYSAAVEMRLIVGERVFPLAQLGYGFAILRNAAELPASQGRIEIWLDGSRSDVFSVAMPSGISAKRFLWFAE